MQNENINDNIWVCFIYIDLRNNYRFLLLDAYQRLQMARNNEQPPGSLRLARRQASMAHTTKPIANIKRRNERRLNINCYTLMF
jgi:hypothetical protein